MPDGRKKQSVLVVDDDPAYVELMQDMIRSFGYDALGAFNGPEGSSLAASAQPSLILLDIVMPGQDGLATLGALKNEPSTRKIPVLMISSQQEGSNIEAAFELGAVGYVIKPVQRTILQRRLQELLPPR